MLTDNPTAPLILVVEDDINHLELIRRSFELAPEEYRIEIAGSVSDAILVVERSTPSLVLTDYHLPDGHGSELVAMAVGSWPIIMMTSQGNEQVAVDTMKTGALDYIVKSPEAFEKLPRTVMYALMAWALMMARRQTDIAALRSKNDWERTFDAVPDLIAIVDTNHTIIRVNKAMADRFDLIPEALVGRRCHEVVHGLKTPPSCCPGTDLVQCGKVHHVRIEEKRLNGVFDITVSPLFDEGNISGCVHVMRDVTEHVKIEAERQSLEKQVQHAQKIESLGVLTGGIAHDFNNILTIILGHCFIMKENVVTGANRDKHILMIETAANRAADLCRQMLAYAGKSPLLQAEFSLLMLVDDIVKMLSSAIKKNVTIALDMKDDIPMIVGDGSQIQQVIMNLIINASEAIGDGYGTISVGLKKCQVQCDQPEADYFGCAIFPGNYVCLEVADTGCGMSDEGKMRVFEPFYTTKFAGRGLGMSAILGIVKSHNGTIQLTSSPCVGTTFKIYFPLIASHKNLEVALDPAFVKMPAPLKRFTILLVDDEETLRIMEKALLETLGFDALTAANGREALELYKTHSEEIDLIMLDLVMPEMGGVEAYYELRKMNASVPIIICSGYGAESVLEITEVDSNASFLHKPYNPVDLCRVLSRKIDAKY